MVITKEEKIIQTPYFDIKGKVNTRIYMNHILRGHKTYSKAISQLILARDLPGIIEPILGMPDLTASYCLPVGSVLAIEPEKGVISLSAIGGDINCGISLSQTNVPYDLFNDIKKLNSFSEELEKLFKDKSIDSSINFKDILIHGLESICNIQDREKVENLGSIKINNKNITDENLLKLSHRDFGTLGGGNHFIDLMKCMEIFDYDLSCLWGINKEDIQLMVHSGSRGLGSYINQKYKNSEEYSNLTDKIFQPRRFYSEEGKNILDSHNIASNYAYANRHEL